MVSGFWFVTLHGVLHVQSHEPETRNQKPFGVDKLKLEL